MEIEPGIFFIA